MSIIIAGFSGSGKTYMKEQCNKLGIKVKDSDSSTFDKTDFPRNYIENIKENIAKAEKEINMNKIKNYLIKQDCLNEYTLVIVGTIIALYMTLNFPKLVLVFAILLLIYQITE